MPCICYGAISGEEAYDDFIKSEKGKETLDHIAKAAFIIVSHRLHEETLLSPFDFRGMFVKCFLHLMVGCDEQGKPKAN